MANPLFYRNVVPLNRETHRKLKLKALAKPLDYARAAHLIPAVVDEFAAAATELPIAFLPGAATPTPVFITGLKPGTNSFITADGRWDAGYLPAYLRRYPFIIGDVPDADPVLCIDDAYEALGEREGKRLFSTAGVPEPTVTEALELANQYRAAAGRTDNLAELLQRWGLFRSVTLDVNLPAGGSTVIHGLLAVDETALAALDDERFLELRRAGFLKAIDAHLLSLAMVSRLAARAAPVASIGHVASR
jgi:hypothetical protein